MEKVAQYCPCLDEAVQYLDDGLAGIADSGDVSSATSAAPGSAASIVECFATSSGAYQTEKYEIMKNEESKGGILLPSQEIGLKFYSQLVGAIVLCAVSGKCDDILNTITELWDDTVEAVGENLVGSLRAYIASIIEPVQVNLETFNSIMDEFNNSVSCAWTTLKNNLKTLLRLLGVSQMTSLGWWNLLLVSLRR